MYTHHQINAQSTGNYDENKKFKKLKTVLFLLFCAHRNIT